MGVGCVAAVNGYRCTDWEYANYVAHLRAGRGAGITAVPMEAQRIDVVTRYIVEHTHPDEPIFVVPWAAGFYFLADRANPTRADFMLFEDPELYPCLLSRARTESAEVRDLRIHMGCRRATIPRLRGAGRSLHPFTLFHRERRRWL